MGLIRNSNQTKQGIDFTGLQSGAIHPTDIDAVLEFSNRILILFEMKREGSDIPTGQRLVLERIVNQWSTNNKVGLAFKITHKFKDNTVDVPIEQCRVESIYMSGLGWVEPKSSSVKELLNRIGVKYNEPKLRF